MLDTPPHPLYTRADVPVRSVAVREEVSMRAQQAGGWSRREFLGGLALTETVGLLGLLPRWVAAEPPPETATLRLYDGPVTCIAPTWVAHDLLSSEGFTEVHYVTWGRQTQNWVPEALLAGEADLALTFPPRTSSISTRVTRSSSWPGATSAASNWSAMTGSDPRGT
jgi:hypothetical protein